MNTPNSRTITPATRCPTVDRSQVLRALAVNPKIRVKTTVKPMTNRAMGAMRVQVTVRGRTARESAGATGAELDVPPVEAPVAVSPVTNERNPGTRGSTQGDAKDTTPAAKANAGAHHCWIWSAASASMPTILPAGVANLRTLRHSGIDACERVHKRLERPPTGLLRPI